MNPGELLEAMRMDDGGSLCGLPAPLTASTPSHPGGAGLAMRQRMCEAGFREQRGPVKSTAESSYNAKSTSVSPFIIKQLAVY